MKAITEVRSILFVALSGIGNFLMQSPAIILSKQHFPQARITVWVAPRGTKPLAQNLSAVDEVIEAPIKMSLSNHLHHVWQLSRERFQVGIVLSPGQLIKSAAYLYLAGAKTRIGGRYPFMSNRASGFLLTHPVAEEPHIHDIEQNVRLLAPLGIESSFNDYDLPLPAAAHDAAARLLATLNIPGDKRIIGFHPGCSATMLWKRWPLEYFAEVGKALAQKYSAHILIFGGPDETAQMQELAKQLPGMATTVTAPLLTTAAAIKHCALFLSNDSGLMHVAAAVGVPTYGLFGPTDEVTTGPRGKNSYVIRAAGTTPVFNTETNFYLGQTTHETLLQLSPELVLQKLQLAV
jgi:heptosyltransferase-2